MVGEDGVVRVSGLRVCRKTRIRFLIKFSTVGVGFWVDPGKPTVILFILNWI